MKMQHICQAVCALALTAALLGMTACQQPPEQPEPNTPPPVNSQPTEPEPEPQPEPQPEGGGEPEKPNPEEGGEQETPDVEIIPGIESDVDSSSKTATIFQYTGSESTLVIPEFIWEDNVRYTVTCIGWCAFLNNDVLCSVTIPTSVKSIEDYAFQGCRNLNRAVILNGAKTIGESAFRSCDNLQSIYIPSSVISIGPDVFKDTPPDLKIYYGGSQEQWNELCASVNLGTSSATVSFDAKPENMPKLQPPVPSALQMLRSLL